MFRSENMSLNQIMFAKESMWDTMNFLAASKKVMIVHPKQKTPSHNFCVRVFFGNPASVLEEDSRDRGGSKPDWNWE